MLETFLILVAAFLVAFVAFAVGVFFYVRHKLRKMFKGLGDALHGLAGAASMLPPARITLVPAHQIAWHHPAEVAKATDDLRAAGFVEAGTYTLEGDATGVRLRGFVHEGERVYATIYDTPAVGPYADVGCRYADGRSLTYSTSPETGLDRPPDKPIRRFDSLDPASLFHRFLAEREPGACEPTPPGGFAAAVERYYAEEMDWRANRGGLTDAEVRRQAARVNQPDLDAQSVRQVRMMFLAKLNDGLEDRLREAFLATGTVSAAAWDDLQHEVAFVHNRMPEEQVGSAFRAAIGYGDDVDDRVEALQDRVREIGARAAFAEANAAAPPERRFTKLAELAEPVPCDVYREPPALPGEDA